MPALIELAEVVRSKNACPYEITIDLMFEDEATFDRVWSSGVLSDSTVADLYKVPPEQVRVIELRSILAIKVSFPRPGASSGAAGDRDVYGAQQHGPLASLVVADGPESSR